MARGAGVQLKEVGDFMQQYEMSRDMMKAVGSMGMGGKIKLMKSFMSGNLANMAMPGAPGIKIKKSGFMEKKDRNKKKKR